MASTIRTIFGYRNPDLTKDLNDKQKDLIRKGVFSGGAVVPVQGQLAVSIDPFSAMGTNGMITILSGDPYQIDVIPGQTQRVVGRFIYKTDEDPDVNIEVLSESEFDQDAEKPDLITFARIQLSPAATSVLEEDIDLTVSDKIDPQGRLFFRGLVDTENDLPTESSSDTKEIRDGDIYFIVSTGLFYYWDSIDLEWNKVVDNELISAFEDHQNNLDPNSRHISAGADAALSNPVSGESLSEDNVVVDTNFTFLGRNTDEFDVTDVYQVQLTGEYFVGNGDIHEAKLYFLATKSFDSGDGNFDFRQHEQLLGSDDMPITVLGLYVQGVQDPVDPPTPSNPGPGTLINPQSDADADGYIENPVVRFNFEYTDDDGYTGTLAVHAGKKINIGEVTPNNIIKPLAFYPGASLITASTVGYNKVDPSDNNVQDQLKALDSAIHQEVLDRQSAVQDAITNLLEDNNIWLGNNTWEEESTFNSDVILNERTEFNSDVILNERTEFNAHSEFNVDSEETADSPRQLLNVYDNYDRTLFFKGDPEESDVKVRKYIRSDGVLEFVVGAYFEDGEWNKDSFEDRALKFEAGQNWFDIKTWQGPTGTGDTFPPFDVSLIRVEPILNLGNDLSGITIPGEVTFESGSGQGSLPRHKFPVSDFDVRDRTLITEFGNDSANPIKCRIYRVIQDPSPVGTVKTGSLEITHNAEWNSSLETWTMDNSSNSAYKFESGIRGIYSYHKTATSETFDEVDWENNISMTHLDAGSGGMNKITAPNLHVEDSDPVDTSSSEGYTNTIIAKSMPKAWACIEISSSIIASSSDGFNIDIDNASIGGSGNNVLTVPFPSGGEMADTNYCVQATLGGNSLYTANVRPSGKSQGEFDIECHWHDDGSSLDLTSSFVEVHITVFGNQ